MRKLAWLKKIYADNTDADSRQRFLFFTVACSLVFLAMLGFGIYNLATSGFSAAAPGLGTASVLAVMLVLSSKPQFRAGIYFTGIILVTAFLLYLMMLGGEQGSLSYWMFCLPITYFFLMGKRMGVAMALIALAGIVVVFYFPAQFSIDTAPDFQPVAKMRFLVTYLLVSLFSFSFEAVRARLAADAAERLANLESANEHIAKLSVTDILTGCYNRLFFEDKFPGELKRAVRYDVPLSLVLCDIDFFKKVNDSYGHQAGDRVLSDVAAALKNSIRCDVDWVARCGGEEFAIVLPNTEVKGASIVADRMRKAIKNLEVQTPEGMIRVTASFGVSEVSSPEETTTSFYERADKRLYSAKENGRNAVVHQ